MRAVFFSTCVVLIIAIAPEAWSAVVYKEVEGWSAINHACIKGHKYKTLPDLTIEACRKICEGDGIVCKSITYHPSTSTCRFSGLGSTSHSYTQPCYNDGHVYTERTTEKVNGWSDINNACIKNHKYKTLPDVTIEACRQICEGDGIVCKSITYHPSTSTCRFSGLGSTSHSYTQPCYNDGHVYTEKITEKESAGSSEDSSEELECPEGFFIPPGSLHQCFKFYGEKRRNWFQANIKCGEHGLRLAKPFNALALRAYLVERYGPDARVHVGARGTGSKMVWEHDGREIGPENTLWRNSQPGNKITTDYCLEISAGEHQMNQEPEKPYWPGLCSVEIFTLCEFVE